MECLKYICILSSNNSSKDFYLGRNVGFYFYVFTDAIFHGMFV